MQGDHRDSIKVRSRSKDGTRPLQRPAGEYQGADDDEQHRQRCPTVAEMA